MNIKNDVQNLDIVDSSEPFDVCIIRSGPPGTVLGRELIENKLSELEIGDCW